MKRHIVLTLGRSGSNTLCDMLNQHPGVLNFGEVLGDWNLVRKWERRLPFLFHDEAAFLDHVLCARSFPPLANAVRSLRKRRKGRGAEIKRMRRVETYGVKEFSLHFDRFGLDDFLAARPEVQVIGLARHNVVDRMVSTALLQSSGVVALRGKHSDPDARLRLDPARLLPMLDEVAAENAGLERHLAALSPARVLRIDYDDLFRDPAACQTAMDRVFAFLGVAPLAVAPRMRRIRKAPLSSVVENYDDCLEALRGTAYHDLFQAAGG